MYRACVCVMCVYVHICVCIINFMCMCVHGCVCKVVVTSKQLDTSKVVGHNKMARQMHLWGK